MKKYAIMRGFRITESGRKYLTENYDAIRYFTTNDFNWNDLQIGLLSGLIECGGTCYFFFPRSNNLLTR
jgi:hypothetical protein